MTRSYADASYAGRKQAMLPPCPVDGTYAALTTISTFTCMFPITVVDWNVALGAGGTNFGADCFHYLGSSDAGTGSVSIIGTWDCLQATGTFADYSASDASCTETSFSAGDDVVIQAIGTLGGTVPLYFYIEYIERFIESDT